MFEIYAIIVDWADEWVTLKNTKKNPIQYTVNSKKGGLQEDNCLHFLP